MRDLRKNKAAMQYDYDAFDVCLCVCVLCTMRVATINGFLIHFTWQFDLANNINTNRAEKVRNDVGCTQRAQNFFSSFRYIGNSDQSLKSPVCIQSIVFACLLSRSASFHFALGLNKKQRKIINYSTITLHFSCTHSRFPASVFLFKTVADCIQQCV